ncbi:LysR substrate-binding domain-containing protein [Massilia sp. CFBP9026]|uniref:LysR substrate-binding domain-containing protein n=1 Tax=Massilia sp. CFBP9026 TaxID=3096536 RepID=UPI002A6A319A|nr:LysR substrate-binding domain-containing protein [Massilia sp. CFBP9026]MDY0960722.1 LysR substrate-binding domain-containing protein [Massilia sp. CFBP9026]
MKNDLASHLEFFVLLARHGNLSAAARELDLTPPAATKRLAQLEQHLGVRLVNRTTRTSSLTPEGETYLHYATRILAELREMEEAVSSTRSVPRGLLKVNASLGFGRTAIAPLVSSFAQRYPQVEVQLDVTDRPIDLVANGIDLAIRFGELPDQRLVARRIMSNRRFLCASPRYLERHGEPGSLADLAQHRCIVHRQNEDAHGVWRLVHEGRNVSVKVQGTLSSNDGDIVLGWALDGHGILVRSEWDLKKYVDSGRLRIVLPQYVQPAADLYVVYPGGRRQSARARAFIDFLAAQFAPS